MTRKDYINIADALIKTVSDKKGFQHDARISRATHVRETAINLLTVFESDNPRFDSVRFMQYIDDGIFGVLRV